MEPVLKLIYVVDNDSLTDEEFEKLPERELIVTESMIVDLIRTYDTDLKRDDIVNYEYVTLIKL